MKFSTIAILAACAVVATAAPAPPSEEWQKSGQKAPSPFTFTSVYVFKATPDQVVNGSTNPVFTGGLEGASGDYFYGLNSYTNTICYNITLYNFRGYYQSLAITATHIHQAARGENGPPRIAFPNPVEIGPNVRRSVGCLTGPFRTGVNTTGTTTDTGANFTVAQIEQNLAGFFTDVHSSLAIPGAVRGQLS